MGFPFFSNPIINLGNLTNNQGIALVGGSVLNLGQIQSPQVLLASVDVVTGGYKFLNSGNFTFDRLVTVFPASLESGTFNSLLDYAKVPLESIGQIVESNDISIEGWKVGTGDTATKPVRGQLIVRSLSGEVIDLGKVFLPVPLPDLQPSPVPLPDPQPSPVPLPDFQPSPVPLPDSQPSPVPLPDSQPSPVSQPDFQLSPVPQPDPQPSPVPQLDPQPSPVPQPDSQFSSVPQPDSQSNLVPQPDFQLSSVLQPDLQLLRSPGVIDSFSWSFATGLTIHSGWCLSWIVDTKGNQSCLLRYVL